MYHQPPAQFRQVAPVARCESRSYFLPGKRPPAFFSGEEAPPEREPGEPAERATEGAAAVATPKPLPDLVRIAFGDAGC